MTRTELTPETIAIFRDRFGRLHDALILNISVDLFPYQDHKPYTITINLATQDGYKEDPDRWIYLRLHIEDITDYIFKKKENHDSSVIFKSSLQLFDDKIYLDFNRDPSGYHTATEFMESIDEPGNVIFMIAGKRGYWEEITLNELF